MSRPDYQKRMEWLEEEVNGLFLLDGFIIGEQGRFRGLQKLIEGQRGYVQQVGHAYGIEFRLGQQSPQQIACCNLMVLVGLLLEIFQSV